MKKTGLKKLIEMVVGKYDSTTQAGEDLGICRKKLSYWMQSNAFSVFIHSMEAIRRKLGIPRSEMWDRLMGDR